MADLPNIDDVKAYLGQEAQRWTDEELDDTLEAETDIQANKCRVIDPYPAALRRALLRRVMRALATKQNAFGVSLAVDGETSFVPRWDGEIRRLEAPYRRLVVG